MAAVVTSAGAAGRRGPTHRARGGAGAGASGGGGEDKVAVKEEHAAEESWKGVCFRLEKWHTWFEVFFFFSVL